ncbi:MAG: hypothetical protein A3G92_02295 [Deltaproteobacteria bacterium RIFCSPLOWO2_12_FULL_38_8]|nr:MAG: hypothetical protein A3G92_02295 [Deltaproteobacteria bacterium RIFCSPLOWO2_12_FULL_38_8]
MFPRLFCMSLLMMKDQDKIYWKSFEELTQDPRYLELAQREFMEEDDGSDFFTLSRRKFLKLLGASVALATTACRRPVHKIFPYVRQPETLKPGVAQYYASTFALNNHSYGILVKTIEGRPIKIEGNPDHPLSLGSASTFAQASILELYDPDRKRKPTIGNKSVSLDEWNKEIISLLKEGGNKQIRLLTESITSPTLRSTIEKFIKKFPNTKWYEYEPISQETARQSYQHAFGRPNIPKFHLEKADILLSINADILGGRLDSNALLRQWANKRKITSPKDTLNRLYVAESYFSLTGSNADHRLALKPSELLLFSLQLAKLLVYRFNLSTDSNIRSLLKSVPDENSSSYKKEFLGALAHDLSKNRGKSLVLVGEQESLELQIVGHFINSLLQSYGTTIDTKISTASFNNGFNSLKSLTQEMEQGKVDILITVGGNIAYQTDSKINDLFKKIPHHIRLSLYNDETTALSHYAAPLSHDLESWGDSQPETGMISLIQPTIQPLHDSRSLGEVLMSWIHEEGWLTELKTYWKNHIYSKQPRMASFEAFWEAALHNGVVFEKVTGSHSFTFKPEALHNVMKNLDPRFRGDDTRIELQLHPSYTVYDGRFANIGSLQELPDPVTKVTWDNVASLSPNTAQKLGVKQGDIIEIENKIKLPIFLQPGLADGVITTSLGYGRSKGGEVGIGVGSTVFALGSQFQHAIRVKKLSGHHKIATTQAHHSMEGRPIVLEAPLEEYKHTPDFPKHKTHTPELFSMYEEYPYPGHKWGMAIDLTSCVGCSGCVVACDVENNIPSVGKAQVLKGREMQWMRLDRYYETSLEHDIKTVHQPMLCQHCDNAPCETVCPVAATTHSSEGINQMTYNRCVGTRYCANNCPYKVRRFNYFNFNNSIEYPQELGKNPDVTIRMRGVMEKCTFCIQRISEGKNAAKMRGEPVLDGSIKTACQEACPTEAIIFGDLNDPHSKVSKASKQSHGYHVLEELNVRPAITYLAKIRNPHPKLEKFKI